MNENQLYNTIYAIEEGGLFDANNRARLPFLFNRLDGTRARYCVLCCGTEV